MSPVKMTGIFLIYDGAQINNPPSPQTGKKRSRGAEKETVALRGHKDLMSCVLTAESKAKNQVKTH